MDEQSAVDKLYDVLKLIFKQIDSPENPQLKSGEYINLSVCYTGELQKEAREALKAYENSIHCHGGRNCWG